MPRRSTSVFENKQIAAKLAHIHDKYIVVPADKASSTVVFICKQYYIQCLTKELGMRSAILVSNIKLIKPPISLNRKYFPTTNQFFHHMV